MAGLALQLFGQDQLPFARMAEQVHLSGVFDKKFAPAREQLDALYATHPFPEDRSWAITGFVFFFLDALHTAQRQYGGMVTEDAQ